MYWGMQCCMGFSEVACCFREERLLELWIAKTNKNTYYGMHGVVRSSLLPRENIRALNRQVEQNYVLGDACIIRSSEAFRRKSFWGDTKLNKGTGGYCMGLSTEACFLKKKSFESPIWRRTGGCMRVLDRTLLQETNLFRKLRPWWPQACVHYECYRTYA